jgi:hypothetical protein
MGPEELQDLVLSEIVPDIPSMNLVLPAWRKKMIGLAAKGNFWGSHSNSMRRRWEYYETIFVPSDPSIKANYWHQVQNEQKGRDSRCCCMCHKAGGA